MALRKLFLCHYNGDAAEVRELAAELRLHGIVPWVDKHGGFRIADDCEPAARRAIRQECFGLLVYATEEVFRSLFIRNVEVDQARGTLAEDPTFALFAVPRRMGFTTLKDLSITNFGIDLSRFHTRSIDEGEDTARAYREISQSISERILEYRGNEGVFCFQYSTREIMPHAPDDVLCIDATEHFSATVENPLEWSRLLCALKDTKRALANTYGRPRLRVHGSKHLAAAFMLGRVFAPYDMELRQSPDEVWSTDFPPSCVGPLIVTTKVLPNEYRRLFVEIASRKKDVPRGVDEWIASSGHQPSVRLQLASKSTSPDWDNGLCCAAVNQTYDEIESVLRQYLIAEVHLFTAVPQAFMTMLGRKFKGIAPAYLYEWTGERYVQACRLPGGVV